MTEIIKYIEQAEKSAIENRKAQNLFSSACKLAGLEVLEVLQEAKIGKDYFYQRRKTGTINPTKWLHLLNTLKNQIDDKTK